MQSEPQPSCDLATLRARYLAAQLAGDRREALRLLIEEGLKCGASVEDVQLRVIQEAQREIGVLWQENRISIAEEHMATAISSLALAHVFQHASSRPANGRKVVVACVDGELHDFPARLVADALDLEGFDVRFLGASVPVEALLAVLAKEQPDLLALSVTMSFNVPRSPAELRAREVISRQLAHLSRLVDDLLDVSRATSGKIELRKEPVDLVTLLTRVATACREVSVSGRGQSLNLVLPEAASPVGSARRLASAGPGGVSAIVNERPEVALVDIGLPNLNGYEVARAVRNDPDGAVVFLVALTGYGSPEQKKMALESGFDLHLTKPVDPELLQRLLHDLGKEHQEKQALGLLKQA